jgi:aldehyde dehydrogenase (NAD+)
LIDGAWIDAPQTEANVSPSDIADVIGHFPLATADMVDGAVDAAKRAFPAWSREIPEKRADILDRIGQRIAQERAFLGEVLAREEGKVLADALAEVDRASRVFRFFAGEALRVTGETVASLRGQCEATVRRRPLGVVGMITPWNFPIAIPAWKIAPALAFGNCVVLKPAELTPACAWHLARIIRECGVPAGVFNLVCGSGAVVGDRLVRHRGVAAISFTGSTTTGARIAAIAAGRMARVQLEMGGKNPLVVLADADLDQAIEIALNGAFFQTGQRCTASSRLIVEASVHDAFVSELAARLRSLNVGHALDADSTIGPVVSEPQLAKDVAYIRAGREEGAQLVTGGEVLERRTEGFYLSPALFAETTNEMRINREEIFGPVAGVIRVADYDEALAVANDTEFGLSAGICTASHKIACHFRDHAEAGMVMINLPTAGVDYHVPFGGSKGSSFGSREQGRQAVEFYTSTYTAYDRPL